MFCDCDIEDTDENLEVRQKRLFVAFIQQSGVCISHMDITVFGAGLILPIRWR
jgi:hypothetical protein